MLKVKSESRHVCLSCGEKERSRFEVKINREKNDENIITFSLCKACMNKLAREFYPYS